MSADTLSLDQRHIGSAMERTDEAHESMRGALNTMKKIAGPLVVALLAALGGSMLLDRAADAGKISAPDEGGMLDAFRDMGNNLNGKAAEFSAWIGQQWNARFGAETPAVSGTEQPKPSVPYDQGPATPQRVPDGGVPEPGPAPAPSPTPTELYEADPSPSDLRPYDEAPASGSPSGDEPPVVPAPAEPAAASPVDDLPEEDPFAEPTETRRPAETSPAAPSEPAVPETSSQSANPNSTPEPDLDAETEDVLRSLEEGV